MDTEDGIESALAGKHIYGDGFSPDEIEAWYESEREGYSGLGASDRAGYRYGYHALNQRHGFRHLGDRTIEHALGLGSAYGDEFLPISERISRLTIVDPSDHFVSTRVHGIPTEYAKPSPEGRLPFEDDSFDLVCALGVLHHIPNVSFVATELKRVCRPGGLALIREPIVSMGDWRKPRRGLTRNERGIPLSLFRGAIEEAGFVIEAESLCVFPPLVKAVQKAGISTFNSGVFTRIDEIVARMFRFNYRYHALSTLERFRPSSAFYVVRG